MGVQQPIPIQLDKLRHLKMDLRALTFAERELARFWGVPRVSVMQHFQNIGQVGMADLAIMFWAGLRHEDPALTMDAAFDLMGLDFTAATAVLKQAMEEHLGARTAPASSESGVSADPPQPTTAAIPSNSIGSNSGAPGGSISG